MKYTRSDNVATRTVAGEHLLIPVKGCTKQVFTLNGVGRGLWGILEEPRTEEDLAQAVVARFGIPLPTAENDVRVFLKHMLELALVRQID